MIFDIDFLCSDLRPLRGKNKNTVEYIKPQYKFNEILYGSVERKKDGWFISRQSKSFIESVRKAYMPFYKNMGIINTRANSPCTFFKTRNSIKFPTFNVHHIKEFKSESNKYKLVRKDHVRRHFSIDAYGVANRLRLGFSFDLNTYKEKKAICINEQTNTFKILKAVFNIPVSVKKYPTITKISQLSECLCEIISDSTTVHTTKQKEKHQKTLLHPDVRFQGATATIIYKKGELPTLPRHTEPFLAKDCPEDIKLFFYNYDISPTNSIRVYFIEYEDNPRALYFAHKLKSKLLELRMTYITLHEAVFELGLITKKHKSFVLYLSKKIHYIRENVQYGFIDLKLQDRGEVYTVEKRQEYNARIGEFTQNKHYFL